MMGTNLLLFSFDCNFITRAVYLPSVPWSFIPLSSTVTTLKALSEIEKHSFSVETFDCQWGKMLSLVFIVMETIMYDSSRSAEVAMAYLLINCDVNIWITKKRADKLDSTVSIQTLRNNRPTCVIMTDGLSVPQFTALSGHWLDGLWGALTSILYLPGYGPKPWYCYLLMHWLKAETGHFTDLSEG